MYTPRLHLDDKAEESGLVSVAPEGAAPASAVAPAPASAESRRIPKTLLINKLNYANFQNCLILVQLRHQKYGRYITCQARPLPCGGDRLDCLWRKGEPNVQNLKSYRFEQFHVVDGQSSLRVRPELAYIDEHGIGFRLPDFCEEISQRRIVRHPCQDIRTRLLQNSTLFHGELEDFNAISFRVRLETTASQPFRIINPDASVHVILSSGFTTHYSGECRIIKQSAGHETRHFILEPVCSQIQKLSPKEFRSSRQILNPTPDIVFRHPLTGRMVILRAVDISGSGFSVHEDWHGAVLIPGLIIPEVEISFAGSLSIRCSAQVIYSRIQGSEREAEHPVRCGFSILDIDSHQHAKLTAIVYHVQGGNATIGSKVDLDALWNFFFETGFISPYKYAYIQKNKGQIKETYRRLYTENPHVARHFICQEKGTVLGHMAMVRFHENAWMIHHHAARKSCMKRAGLIVLNQIGRFANDAHRFRSMHMDYLLCYFRPDNPFPQKVFGGVAAHMGNRRMCSIDPFAYFHYRRTHYAHRALPALWQLHKVQPQDLADLECFYEQISGGLMLQAVDLHPETAFQDTLTAEYRQLGLRRRRLLVALRKGNVLKAIMVVNLSDIGLNLSDLTNCIQILVVDPEDMSKETLFGALSMLTAKIGVDRLPVLLYPQESADKLGIVFEKCYHLWVIDTQKSDQYFNYLKTLLKFVQC